MPSSGCRRTRKRSCPTLGPVPTPFAEDIAPNEIFGSASAAELAGEAGSGETDGLPQSRADAACRPLPRLLHPAVHRQRHGPGSVIVRSARLPPRGFVSGQEVRGNAGGTGSGDTADPDQEPPRGRAWVRLCRQLRGVRALRPRTGVWTPTPVAESAAGRRSATGWGQRSRLLDTEAEATCTRRRRSSVWDGARPTTSAGAFR